MARRRFVCSKPNRAMSVSSPFCAVFSTPSRAARAWLASMSSVKRAGLWSSCLTAGWLTKSRLLTTFYSCQATAWKGFLAGLATLTPIRTRRGAQGLSVPVLKRCALRAVWSPSCFRVWLLPRQWLSSNRQYRLRLQPAWRRKHSPLIWRRLSFCLWTNLPLRTIPIQT